jgi:plasmid stabilization system protein ParE
VKPYKVILRPSALRDLAGIERWIEQEASAAVARRYGEAILSYCRKLDRFPDRGRPRQELREGLRTVVFRGAVTIAYVVTTEEVHILAIIGRGREIEAVFKDSM